MVTNKEEEKKLVELARIGDDGAFVKLYELYYLKFYKYALYSLRTKEDAEDVVADAIADIYLGIGKLRDASLFENWAFTILSNKCKKKYKEYYQENTEITEESTEIVNATTTDSFEDKLLLWNVLSELKEQDREIIVLSYILGYDSKDIGKILDMPPNTVRSIKKRSIEKLKKAIA